MPREALYGIIDDRVDAMMGAGLVAEVKNLLEWGYTRQLPAMSGIGYRQVCQHLDGELSYEEAVARMKTGTHRYVRQQHNWFRLEDPRIHWYDMTTSPYADIEQLVSGFVAGND